MFTKITRHSYGIIPLRKNDNGDIEVLLIAQKDRLRSGVYWAFPKGTPEDGEEPLETALREVFEETGVRCGLIDPDFNESEHYTFEEGGQQIDKITTYFLGRADRDLITIQEKEIAEALWLTLPHAREKLTYEGAKLILDRVVKHLPLTTIL